MKMATSIIKRAVNSKIGKAMALVTTVVTITGAISAYADYGTSHILGGVNTNGPGFQYWLDSTVANYGYTDTITNAATNWSAVTNSTANLWEISNGSLAQIKYYVTYGELPSGVFGATDYWDRASNGNLTIISASNVINGTNFDMSRIRLDHKSMSDAGYTWEQRLHNTGHETGHALSLYHFENSPAHSGDHWMKSGQISLSAPTSTDADHLANKW